MIIGLTGTLSSGKDQVSEYLMTKGFKHYSLSDILREIAEERGIEKTRDNLRELANDVAHEKGAESLAKEALARIGDVREGNFIISAIRKPEEVKLLKQRPDFIFIAVDADPTLRWERSQKRAREGENKQTFDEFMAKEKAETSGNNVQRLDVCISMADYKVMNNGTIEDLNKKVDEILKEHDIK
ncbi:AAA family ATPase [Patescibacteria group bacterium]